MFKKNSANIIDIQPLLSARKVLHDIVKDAENEYEYMGAVQAFEICYELAWTTLKKVLAFRGIEAYSPREVFRKSYLEGLIPNFDTWINYLKTRNLTVHTYNEDILHDVWNILPQFLKDLDKLVKKIKDYGQE